LQRSKAYWRWLVNRQAYDQIYVALDGPGLLELDEVTTQIVGFAVTKGDRIVELMTAPGERRAAAELLARCCGDAIEHDRQAIQLHAMPNKPIHDLFQRAGGICRWHESDEGEVYMAKLLEPLKLLRMLCGEFYRRAEEAGLPRPVELGLLVEGRKYRIEVTDRSARAISRHLGRSYLQLNVADFTRLVLGQLDWRRTLAEGLVQPSTDQAVEAGRVLFPRLPLWRPPLDDLLA